LHLPKEFSKAESRDTESRMVWIINQLADKFGNHAILKGGMELRLFDCPRYTNDLDYIFIPFASKNEISKTGALKQRPTRNLYR
jgi:predicted nucleotidyltransferase component of viral defense system